MFKNHRIFETELAGRKLTVDIGKIAQLANGSCFIRYGDTVINVAVTASEKPREGVDFFPLSVDFEERLYAVGKIPGSFSKREGRPTDKAILASRVIDRPIRPLFPKNMVVPAESPPAADWHNTTPEMHKLRGWHLHLHPAHKGKFLHNLLP